MPRARDELKFEGLLKHVRVNILALRRSGCIWTTIMSVVIYFQRKIVNNHGYILLFSARKSRDLARAREYGQTARGVAHAIEYAHDNIAALLAT